MTMFAYHLQAGLVGFGESFLDLERLFESLSGDQLSVGWLLFGLAAQLIMVGCLLAQWYASRRHGRIVIRSGVVYVGLVATVMLLVYASIRHDLVYVVGQILNVLIGLRLLELLRRTEVRRTETDMEHFPRIEPESAERRSSSGTIAPKRHR